MEWFKKYKIKEWLIFFTIIFIFLYLDVFIVAAYYMTGNDLNKLSLYSIVLILLSKYLVLVTIFLIRDHKYLKEKWIDFKKNFKKYAKISFSNWFVGFIIMILSNIIISYFVKNIGQNESTVQELIKKLPLIAFFLTTICAPFIEEMVFRRYLQVCFNNKTVYMIFSGLIFGLIHTSLETNIWEILLIIPYGALGLMFAKTINETDNVYATIMTHMFHNGALTLLAIWGI